MRTGPPPHAPSPRAPTTRPWSLATLALAVACSRAPAETPPRAPTPAAEPRAARVPPLPARPTAAAPAVAAASVAPLEEPPREPTGPVRLLAVGDIMLGRTVGERIARDPRSTPFAHVEALLRGADLAVGNLECVLGEGGTEAKKSFTFRAPSRALSLLEASGLDVVLVANNHILDFGPEPLGPMLASLDASGIRHAGAGLTEEQAHAPAIVTSRGLRVAFLGYVNVPREGGGRGGFDARDWEARGAQPGVAWADPPRVAAEVTAARARADVVIVLLHAGNEELRTTSRPQRDAARAAIDAGAAAVLGSHPHRVQALERYHGGIIAYSLGDFVFDGRDILSAMLELELTRSGVTATRWIPLHTARGTPTPYEGRARADWKLYLERLAPPEPPPRPRRPARGQPR